MTLTHVDATGRAAMVDVSGKSVTIREAKAQALICMNATTLELIKNNQLKKGDVLSVARIAGIQAAKKTADLIPLCHPLALSKVTVDFEFLHEQSAIRITGFCKLAGQTGVEMEALTAASIAALTIYDMAKAMDKNMIIQELCLLYKAGGRSGVYEKNTEESRQAVEDKGI